MRLLAKAIVLLASTLAAATPAARAAGPHPSPSTPVTSDLWATETAADAESGERDGWIEGLVSTMSLHDKIGQMFMIDVQGTQLTPEFAQHLSDGGFGNVIFFEHNLQSEEQTAIFVRQLQENAVIRTGAPMLVAVDQEGGLVNRLGPVTNATLMKYSARTLGRVYQFAPAKARRILNRATAKVADRMRTLGFNMNLAPVLDLTNDKQSFIYERSYGDDPETVSRLASDYAQVMATHGVVPTGKHFPNLSMTKTDSHQSLPVLDRSLKELLAHELVPFEKAKSRLGAIMVGHVLVPAIDPTMPASVSPPTIKLLRRTIGFDGVVITDDVKMKALSTRYSVSQIVRHAVDADVDIVLMAWDPTKQLEATRSLEAAVAAKEIPLERIDRSVRRILELKQRFAR